MWWMPLYGNCHRPSLEVCIRQKLFLWTGSYTHIHTHFTFNTHIFIHITHTCKEGENGEYSELCKTPLKTVWYLLAMPFQLYWTIEMYMMLCLQTNQWLQLQEILLYVIVWIVPSSTYFDVTAMGTASQVWRCADWERELWAAERWQVLNL